MSAKRKTRRAATPSPRRETTVESPFTRVYFIGAGFSAGMGYPTGPRILPTLVRRLRGFRDDGSPLNQSRFNSPANGQSYRKRLLGLIEGVLTRYFAVTQRLVNANPTQIDDAFRGVDLGEFFTVVQAFSDGVAPFSERGTKQPMDLEIADEFSIEHLYPLLAATTRTQFVDTCLASKWPKSVSGVLQDVNPLQHALVTYNWDEEVEYFICQYENDVSYTLRDWQVNQAADYSTHLLLKPHGSVGWYDVGQGIANEDMIFVAGDDDRLDRRRRRLAGYYHVELPRDLDGKDHPPHLCPPAITPPTYTKKFTYEEQRLVWQDMFTVCSAAREFVFLGYSLPRDDFWTRTALRRALHNHRKDQPVRVLVVSRDWNLDLLNNFRSVYGDGFIERRNYLTGDFGSADTTLATQIDRRLRKAHVASS